VITTTIGIIIGWLLNLTTSTIQEKRRTKIDRLHRQEQIYSQLTGLKIILEQIYLSVNDAFTRFNWIESRERLKLPIRSDLGTIEESRREYSDAILELSRNNQRLWETLGLVRILFFSSEELENLIDPLEHSIKELREYRESISEYYDTTTAESVDNPPEAAMWGVEKKISELVDIPFENLLKHLEIEIKSTKDELNKHLWQL